MKKQLLCMLLALALLCALLPAAALAAPVGLVKLSVDVPMAGQTPSEVAPAVIAGDVHVYAYDWRCDGEKLSNYFDKFELGKTYTLVIVLSSSGEFSAQSTATYINELGTANEIIDAHSIRLRRDFTVTGVMLNDLDVTLPPATAGTKLSKVAEYGVIEGTEGAVVQAIFWRLNGEEQRVNTFFKAGETYEAFVRLYALDGYRFADPLRVRVNGETPYEIVSTGEYATFRLEVTSTAQAKTADAVNATVDAPKTGETPAESAGIFGGGGFGMVNSSDTVPWDYYRNGLAWYDETAQAPLRFDEAFQGGHSYSVSLHFKLYDGYEWPEPSLHRINGKAPASVDAQGDRLTLRYTFPALPEAKTLTSIKIQTPPVRTEYLVGELFDKTGMVVLAVYSDGSEEAVTGYTLSPAGALSESDKAVTVSYSDGTVTVTETTPIAVTAPKKTLVSIAVTTPPAKTQYTAGQSFDPAGMVVTATYSDQSTAAVTGYTVTGAALAESDGFVTVSYTEGTVTVTALQPVTVQAKEEKTDGEKKDGEKTDPKKANPFADVNETDDYYDAVIWAYYAEPQVTNGITATQFGPNSTVTRGQAATFLWRAMGCPEPKSSVSKFEDVQDPNYYYYKAVLWAVEQGIAKGTDETHFTPEQTCSTAHIVTFLYRTMGIGADGWYEVAEAWAQGAGLLKGMSAAVAPGVDCPRAGVVQLLYRALGA
ncbi:MAG: hypothetical protein E7427_04495 [Ruminococcaceae bacterium]|nr:hypothetical protein [Oscillospiraceae bacterium]